MVAFEGTQNRAVISAARFDFFCSNVKQMGIQLEERKARRATEAPSLRDSISSLPYSPKGGCDGCLFLKLE